MDVTEDDIREYARKYGVPEELAVAVWNQESSAGKLTGTSSRGATGSMQVTPIAFKASGVSGDINDPKTNAEAGVAYLAQGYNKTKSYEGAAAYYHAGPNFQRKLQENPDLNDGGIRTVDYASQVATKARNLEGNTVDADRSAASVTPEIPLDASASFLSGPSDTVIPQPDQTPGPTIVTAQRDKTGSALEDLLSKAKGVTEDILASGDSLKDKIKQNLAAQAANYRKEGELQANMKLDEFQQKKAVAAERASALSAFHINTSDSDNMVAEIASSMITDKQQVDELEQRIIDKQNTGLLPNPLDYIMSQLTVNDDIRNYNMLNRRIERQKDFIDKVTTVANEVSSSNAGKYTTVSAAGAQAAAELERTKAEERVIDTEDKLTKVDFDSQLRKLNALTAQINMNNALETATANREAKAQTAEQKAQAQQQQVLRDNAVRVAGRVYGYEIPDEATLKRMPKNIRDGVYHIIANGGTGDKFAASPLEAETLLSLGAPNRMPPATGQMSQILTAVRKDVEDSVNKDVTITSKDKRTAAINAGMYTKLNEYINNPRKPFVYGADGQDGASNPFARPTNAVMANDPNASKLKITKAITDAQATLPASFKVTDSFILALAQQKVRDGTYKDISEAAKDVSDYYKSVLAMHNNYYHFDSFGLPAQTQYKGDHNIDYSNYAAVSKELLKQYAQEANKMGASFKATVPVPLTDASVNLESALKPAMPGTRY